jgi:hypothetical protein
MPKEANQFGKVDFVFRNLVAKCFENPEDFQTENLLSSLKDIFDFCLSNYELLEILSKTKDPRSTASSEKMLQS